MSFGRKTCSFLPKQIYKAMSNALSKGAFLECRLRRFCAASVTVPVKLVTAYAWLNCMAVVAIVPIDVYSTLEHKKTAALGYMWMVAFW